VIDSFYLARPSFRVAESRSFREHTLLNRYYTTLVVAWCERRLWR